MNFTDAETVTSGLSSVQNDVSRAYSFPQPDWSKRIPALDGLRGIAILLVLLHHGALGVQAQSKFFSAFVSAGRLAWSGVDLFFVLSGFLIGGILLEARNSPHYFKTFYIRRAYRIFPLYSLITVLFLLRHLPFHFLPRPLGDPSPTAIPWIAYVTMTQNIWMAYIGGYGPREMIVTWSLAVEEQFYLTIPFLIWKLKPKTLMMVLLLLVIGAPLLRELIFSNWNNGPLACYVLMPCRADALCLGVICAYLVRREDAWNLLQTRRRTLYGISLVLLIGIVFMTWQQYPQQSHMMATVGYSWLAWFYTSCLLITISGRVGAVQRLLCNRALIWLGTIAYCAYLIHLPLMDLARRVLTHYFGSSPATVWLSGGLIGMAITVAVATISWQFFEKPLLRRGHMYQY